MNARQVQLSDLCDQYQVDILYCFGSRAKEIRAWLLAGEKLQVGQSSDVDIGVKPGRGVGYSVEDKVHMAQALEDLFSVARVDLVVLPEADPFLAANIIRGERLFARDAYLADEYDLYILRRAGDLAPLERERIELVMRGKS